MTKKAEAFAGEALQTALDLVTRDRNQTHGDVEETFTEIAELWGAVLGVAIAPHQVPICMALLKIVRETKGFRYAPDDLIDSIGYLSLAAGLRQKADIEVNGPRKK